MTPRWTQSASKHGIARADQVNAMLHGTYAIELENEGLDDGVVWLFIGHPHSQTTREIEVLATVYGDGRETVVSHAMALGPKHRQYRVENPDGNR